MRYAVESAYGKVKRSVMQHVKQQIDVDQVTLKDLVQLLRMRGLLVASCTLAFGIAAGVAAFIAPKWYQASVVLSPVAASTSGGMGNSTSSQLGGLAALAGISVGSDSRKSESVAVLQSEQLTERYIERNDLLPMIYRDDWDAEKRTWKKPVDAPTLWKANQTFKKSIRTVATENKTGIITLTIKWKDPLIAAAWANGLVDMTNEFLRNKAIQESELNISYLTNEAAKTSIVEARQAIYTILQGEINKAMLARGSKEYAFKIIDPARPPEKHSSPIKSLWIAVGLFAGFFLSTFGVFAYTSWQ
jgi:uncharacterized protein involved in exopolysaccharide biosynthesis